MSSTDTHIQDSPETTHWWSGQPRCIFADLAFQSSERVPSAIEPTRDLLFSRKGWVGVIKKDYTPTASSTAPEVIEVRVSAALTPTQAFLFPVFDEETAATQTYKKPLPVSVEHDASVEDYAVPGGRIEVTLLPTKHGRQPSGVLDGQTARQYNWLKAMIGYGSRRSGVSPGSGAGSSRGCI
jgi:hypothetical protein